jgi:hypothetical protein
MCLCGRQIERVVFATNLDISLAAERITRGQRADFLIQRGNTVIQNISVRDDQGKVRTTNALGGRSCHSTRQTYDEERNHREDSKADRYPSLSIRSAVQPGF